jgi:hypothetical protein
VTKLPRIDIQGEHKRSLPVQNDTENKCDVLRTSHLQQPTEKSQHFVSNDPDDYCCEPPLDVTSFENVYPTTEELVCCAISEETV